MRTRIIPMDRRQFVRAVLKFIAYQIIGRGMILMFEIGVVVAMFWTIFMAIWGITYLCNG